jgi:Holliday junction resolvase RusA-like endonuclease
MDSEKRIKLLQLKKYKTNFGFLSHYEGPILTKGVSKAQAASVKISSDFQRDAEKFHWTPLPRARIAINFRVFCNQKNPPEIYRIIKYYLDLLKGSVFKDDKQVHYLEASIWRSPRQGSKSSIYIQARKLIDLYKIWDIYQELDQNYDDFDEDVLFPYPYLIDQNLWDIAESQYKLLKNSTISQYDRPGLRPTMMGRFCDIDPLIFDIGHLPSKGESKVFQNNIIDIVSEFCAKYSLFQKIYLPIELDIQVTKSSHKHFTDLDNVATKICKEFKKVVLYNKVYINGYRVYIVDEIEKGIKAGVRLKLLPPGEIMSYNERMGNALSRFEK